MAEPRPTGNYWGSDALPYFCGKKWAFFSLGLQLGLQVRVTFLASLGLHLGLHFQNFRGGYLIGNCVATAFKWRVLNY